MNSTLSLNAEECCQFIVSLEQELASKGHANTLISRKRMNELNKTKNPRYKLGSLLYADLEETCGTIGINLEIPKTIYKFMEHSGTLTHLDYNLFYRTCLYPSSTLTLIKWLYEAFETAHIEYDIPKLDIRKNRDLLFRTVCDMGFADIADYFTCLFPHRYFAIIDLVNYDILHYEIKKNIPKKKEIRSFNILKKAREVDEIGECFICYETAEIISSCSHKYCVSCIEKVYQMNKGKTNNCPYCRVPMDKRFHLMKLKKMFSPIPLHPPPKHVRIRIKPVRI